MRPEQFSHITSSHMVKSSDLNHHGTLFAGRVAEWLQVATSTVLD